MRIFTDTTKIRSLSKNRLNTLLLTIPAKSRDFLEIQRGDTLIWEAVVENEEKYIKVYKK